MKTDYNIDSIEEILCADNKKVLNQRQLVKDKHNLKGYTKLPIYSIALSGQKGKGLYEKRRISE